MRNIQQERGLAESGMLQQDSNMGGGQMVTADFVMTPDVIFKDGNAGGSRSGGRGRIAVWRHRFSGWRGSGWS
jgi:hypothetical protein